MTRNGGAEPLRGKASASRTEATPVNKTRSLLDRLARSSPPRNAANTVSSRSLFSENFAVGEQGGHKRALSDSEKGDSLPKKKARQTFAESIARSNMSQEVKKSIKRSTNFFDRVDKAVQNIDPLSAEEIIEEPNTKMRIRNQLVSVLAVEQGLHGRLFFPLSTLHRVVEKAQKKHLDPAEILKGDWATIGALGSFAKKTSQKGVLYANAKLSDLKRGSVSVVVFGKALDVFEPLQPGAIILLFNPDLLMTAATPQSPCVAFVKITRPAQVVTLGTSVDFGFCAHKRCAQVIDTREEGLCTMHFEKKFDNQRATRMALNDLYTPRPPEVKEKKSELDGDLTFAYASIGFKSFENLENEKKEKKKEKVVLKEAPPELLELANQSAWLPNGLGVSARYAKELFGVHHESAKDQWQRVVKELGKGDTETVQAMPVLHPNSRLFRAPTKASREDIRGSPKGVYKEVEEDEVDLVIDEHEENEYDVSNSALNNVASGDIVSKTSQNEGHTLVASLSTAEAQRVLELLFESNKSEVEAAIKHVRKK